MNKFFTKNEIITSYNYHYQSSVTKVGTYYKMNKRKIEDTFPLQNVLSNTQVLVALIKMLHRTMDHTSVMKLIPHLANVSNSDLFALYLVWSELDIQSVVVMSDKERVAEPMLIATLNGIEYDLYTQFDKFINHFSHAYQHITAPSDDRPP